MDFMNKQLSPEEDDQMEMMLLQMDKMPEFYDEVPGSDNRFGFSNVVNSDRSNPDDAQNPTFNSSALAPSSAGLFPDQGAATERWRGGGTNMAAMREMIFRIAAMQTVHIDPESVKPPKRKNVRISTDPQSVAARHRRERISERIRILQRLVPGGTKMDTASMLDEAIHYVKFLKNQVQSLERVAATRPPQSDIGIGFPVPMSAGNFNHFAADVKDYHRRR